MLEDLVTSSSVANHIVANGADATGAADAAIVTDATDEVFL